jgi:hypothetical protein
MSDARSPKPLGHSKGEPDRVEPQSDVEDVTVEIIDGDDSEELFAPIGQGVSDGS